MAMFGPTPCLQNEQQLVSDNFELTYSRHSHRCIPTTKHWESLHPNNGRCLRQLQVINPHLKESFATEYSTGTTFTIFTLWDLYDIFRCSASPCTYLVTNMHLQCQTYVQYNSRMFSGAKIHKYLHRIRVPDWSIFYMIFSSHFRNWFPCEIFPNTTLLELALDYIKKKPMPTLQARAYALHLTNPICTLLCTSAGTGGASLMWYSGVAKKVQQYPISPCMHTVDIYTPLNTPTRISTTQWTLKMQ